MSQYPPSSCIKNHCYIVAKTQEEGVNATCRVVKFGNPTKCTPTPQWVLNTHPDQWEPLVAVLAQGHLFCGHWSWKRVLFIHSPTYISCRFWHSNLQHLGYKSDSINIRPQLTPKEEHAVKELSLLRGNTVPRRMGWWWLLRIAAHCHGAGTTCQEGTNGFTAVCLIVEGLQLSARGQRFCCCSPEARACCHPPSWEPATTNNGGNSLLAGQR